MMTENEKKECARLASDGMTKVEIARKFNTSTRSVGRAIEKYPYIPYGFIGTESTLNTVQYEAGIENYDEATGDDEPIDFVVTKDEISLYRGDEIVKIKKDEDSVTFKMAKELILLGANLCQLWESQHVPTIAASYASVEISGSEVKVNGNPIYGRLVDRLVGALKTGNDQRLGSLMAFTDKLYQNPSYKAVNGTFHFLEAMDIEIDDDGYIIAYKKVTKDYKDCYTNSIDNSVGKVVSMPRYMVEDDPSKTCSAGLHVCSISYLRHYSGERILKVLINPMNVVSVPEDYYGVDQDGQVRAKMRVCEYTVLSDATGELAKKGIH